MVFVPLALIFIIFAVSRVILRFRDGSMSGKELFFWIAFWIAAAVVIVWPGLTDRAAKYVGINRGADAVVYISVIVIYYMVFRVYVKLNHLEREITRLVRALAIREAKQK